MSYGTGDPKRDNINHEETPMSHYPPRRERRDHRERSLTFPLPRAVTALILVLMLALVTGCAAGVEQAVEEGRTQVQQAVEDAGSNVGSTTGGSTQRVEVTRIVDGDTIEVTPDAAAGNSDVRFLAVDTPETYGGTEPLGPEAKAFTTRKLEGEKVRLEYDEDKVDPYDRALAHVRVQGEERTIQEQLLSQGLAQTAWFPPNELYRQELESIQQDARARGAGIWGLPVSEQCELASRGNGIGEGSAGCEGAS